VAHQDWGQPGLPTGRQRGSEEGLTPTKVTVDHVIKGQNEFHQVRFCRLVVLLRWPTLYGSLTRARTTYIVTPFPVSHFWYPFLSPHKALPDWGR
jgi:hypothetical protein